MGNGGIRFERQGDLSILRLDKARGNAIDEPMAVALAGMGRAADPVRIGYTLPKTGDAARLTLMMR